MSLEDLRTRPGRAIVGGEVFWGFRLMFCGSFVLVAVAMTGVVLRLRGDARRQHRLVGRGLLATFAFPSPSGIVRLLALVRIGAGNGQNVFLRARGSRGPRREPRRGGDRVGLRA